MGLRRAAHGHIERSRVAYHIAVALRIASHSGDGRAGGPSHGLHPLKAGGLTKTGKTGKDEKQRPAVHGPNDSAARAGDTLSIARSADRLRKESQFPLSARRSRRPYNQIVYGNRKAESRPAARHAGDAGSEDSYA